MIIIINGWELGTDNVLHCLGVLDAGLSVQLMCSYRMALRYSWLGCSQWRSDRSWRVFWELGGCCSASTENVVLFLIRGHCWLDYFGWWASLSPAAALNCLKTPAAPLCIMHSVLKAHTHTHTLKCHYHVSVTLGLRLIHHPNNGGLVNILSMDEWRKGDLQIRQINKTSSAVCKWLHGM